MVRRLHLSNYIIGVSVAAFVLNPILRVGLKVDGFLATFLAALLAALILRGAFELLERRSPTVFEALTICSAYSALVLILYIGIWSLMSLQDIPGAVGEMIFVLHALSYPVLAFIAMFSMRRSAADKRY